MKENSIDFFRDEVRNGFFVPIIMKQAWAAQMKVLDAIDDICRKHNITYFADWGTLLGTVRHGGYVPWDDDMDICMKRADYKKFKQIAEKELPENYCIHDYEKKENHWLFLSRVVNNTHISYEPQHMKTFYNFPYLTGVDIFVLDYLYKDPEKERERCEEIKYILALADAIIEGKIKNEIKEIRLLELEEKYQKHYDRKLDNRHMGICLYHLAEEQMERVPENESDSIGQIFPWILKGGKGREKKDYEKVIRLPFEEMEMPVPADYHKVLSGRYHDYFKIRKVWDGHQYPYFESQRENLQKIADFKLPEFHFQKKMLRTQNTFEDGNAMQTLVTEFLEEFEKIQTETIQKIQAGDGENAAQMLVQCQEMAVNLGNYIEQMKGETHPAAKNTVTCLEEYCEQIFKIYQKLANAEEILEDIVDFEECFTKLKAILKKEIIEKKLILFLPDDYRRWGELEPLYRKYASEENTEIYVMPLPVFKKNMFGEIPASEEELEQNAHADKYAENLSILDWRKTEIQNYAFHVIVIQNPYDAENSYLTVPPAFYADKLQKYTKNLIYVMPQKTGSFGEEDKNDIYGLKYSLLMPGAMYADKIIFPHAEMRDILLHKLTEFAGTDTENIWKQKLVQMPVQTEIANETKKQRKTLLYCIGENEFAGNAEKAIQKIEERLGIMTEQRGALDIVVLFYPQKDTWELCNEEENKQLCKVLDKYEKQGYVKIYQDDKFDLIKADAYYGSASPYVCRMVEMKKPVMIGEGY